MAIIYSYPELLNLEDKDLLLISDLSSNKNPTMCVKLGVLATHINVGKVKGSGTTNTLPIWTDGPNGDIGDSQLRQLGPSGSGLYQIIMDNTDRFIINKPSSVTSGDPEYLIQQDGNYKVSMGWDDDGAGFGYLYNWAGDGWRFGSAGNNPELTIVTTAGNEGVTIANNLTVDQNVGIGVTSPVSKLEVDGGDIEIDDAASGLILRSPNGTRYRIKVDNSGNLSATAV